MKAITIDTHGIGHGLKGFFLKKKFEPCSTVISYTYGPSVDSGDLSRGAVKHRHVKNPKRGLLLKQVSSVQFLRDQQNPSRLWLDTSSQMHDPYYIQSSQIPLCYKKTGLRQCEEWANCSCETHYSFTRNVNDGINQSILAETNDSKTGAPLKKTPHWNKIENIGFVVKLVNREIYK